MAYCLTELSVSNEAFGLDKHFPKASAFLDRMVETARINLRRIHKDVVESELEQWMRRHQVQPNGLFGLLHAPASAVVICPDGLRVRYTVAVRTMSAVLRDADIANTLSRLQQALIAAKRVVSEWPEDDESTTALKWKNSVAVPGITVVLEETTANAHKGLKACFGMPRPSLAKFGNEFPNAMTLAGVAEGLLSVGNYYRILEDHSQTVEAIQKLCRGLPADLSAAQVDDKAFIKKVSDFVSAIAHYFDSIGVTIHEMGRTEHNFVMTLNALSVKK